VLGDDRFYRELPKGFFGDPLEESLRMAQAAMKRARKAES
jgi:hypothetical protein